MSQRQLEPDEIAHFSQHGWLLLKGWVPTDEIDAAQAGLFSVYPTPEAFHTGQADFRSEGFRATASAPANAGQEPKFRPMQFAGLREFPFVDQTLNLLALHHSIIAVTEELLQTRDVRLYQAETFAKYTGATSYDQPFHVDYTNHVMLPPRRDGRYGQVQMFLYLSDVEPAHGPTKIVSRTLTDPLCLAQLNALGTAIDSEQVAQWEAAAVSAAGPRGSLLIYAADVLHRGTEMFLPGGARFVYSLGYKAAGADWVGSNPWPRKGFYAQWEPLVNGCSVRQLEVLGFPPPGHDYWDEVTLKGAAERYPSLDLSPWRRSVEADKSKAGQTMRLPARTIPLPMSISEKARTALATGAAREVLISPEVDDIDGWRAMIDAMHARVEPYLDMMWSAPTLDIKIERIGGVDVYVVVRKDLPAAERRKVNFVVHGGGWAFFGGRFVVLPAASLAAYYGGVVYAVDYRTPPDHRYPAALDDCLLVYQELLARFDPDAILVSGESAGGNLAAAMLLKARDVGLPLPGALFLNTPALDLTHSSDSVATNRGVDVVLNEGVGNMADLYRNGADARSPYLSPVLGDLTRGFPPTYLRTGTRDLLLSDTVRMHAALRKAGVEADLYVGEAMPHAGFAVLGVDTPEDEDARADLNRWLARHWRAS